ncbi:hypothetical protein NIES2135_27050 [Leptolyngbya boryana NIES-2135]|jgi:hypothetical protein|uniref:Uncharacterized protein n=1 Tax=Leptolyngbya boryana NIES-2135 TaxID=1973484 RepID=A0A1Z4JGN6_LEPBY|nr:hypothetical protein NIES2135_27050 [Leptolyngbya boryana NIES-2135]
MFQPRISELSAVALESIGLSSADLEENEE